MIETLIPIIQDFGVVVAILLYFVWRDHKTSESNKEEKQNLIDRVEKLETTQREEITTLLVKTNQTIEKNTMAFQRFCDRFKLNKKKDINEETRVISIEDINE